MKIKLFVTTLMLFGLLLVVAAQDDFPDDILEQGDMEFDDPELVLYEEFEDEDAWTSGESDNYTVGVDEDDEVYLIEVDYEEGRNMVWAQDDRVFGDVVIRIETDQLSREENNGYGIICRADPSNNGDGYHFYISGDGYAAILVREDGNFEFLFGWEFRDDIINTGRDDNDLIIVCVDDYLALYINEELVGEAEDDTFSEGVVGLITSIFAEDATAEIAYDELHVWEVEAGGDGPGRTDTSGRDSDVDMDIDDIQDDVEDMLEEGDVEIELDDVIVASTWDDGADDWEEYDQDDYGVEVDDGTYVISSDSTTNLIQAINYGDEYEDVVITVEVEHLTDGYGNSFAILCRVNGSDNENAYSFVVGNDQTYAIGKWSSGGYESLIGSNQFVTDTSLDEDDTYTLTVVCVGDYLAFYVDGELIDEVEDDSFDEGWIGLGAIDFSDGVEAAFDNFVAWEASD